AAGEDEKPIALDMEQVFAASKFQPEPETEIGKIYKKILEKALEIAENLSDDFEQVTYEPELQKLIFFPVKNIINYKKCEGKQYV
ncbi:MAG TPA: hypothetical protein PLD62_11575, partial [Candidatus Cloacimonadota bacterium]|nr:hypothetical protein [Candidatus Cloacimonadota bacterium]